MKSFVNKCGTIDTPKIITFLIHVASISSIMQSVVMCIVTQREFKLQNEMTEGGKFTQFADIMYLSIYLQDTKLVLLTSPYQNVKYHENFVGCLTTGITIIT